MSDLSALIRRVDEDRWLASRFAPAPARARLIALYAVNQAVAHATEAAREPGLAAIRLQWWREALEEVAQGAPPRAHPALIALHQTAPDLAGPLQQVIDARSADLRAAPFARWDELEGYVDATAGALIGLAVHACGGAGNAKTTRAFVQEAGRAWGYVGLARASAHWRLRGRTLAPGLARMEDLAPRARAAYVAARAGARAVPAHAFAAFGYVALAPGYLRALERGRIDTPLLARQIRLIGASATGRI